MSEPTPDPAPQPPKPGPRPAPNPDPVQPVSSPPPWGDDFDSQRAWDTIENLRRTETKLKSELSMFSDRDKVNTELGKARADREELERLRSERLTADERAIKEATERAADEARNNTQAEFLPKMQQAQLKGIAAQFIPDKEQLESFLAITDASKFCDESGDVDEEKVAGHLTAIFARQKPPPRQWGQHSGNGGPPQRPGDTARAALEKRHGVKPS